jgi:hypothetical protein
VLTWSRRAELSPGLLDGWRQQAQPKEVADAIEQRVDPA